MKFTNDGNPRRKQLPKNSLKQSSRYILSVSIVAALMTLGIVSLGLILIGIDTSIAILLGCIATATAPAAILDVVNEHNRPNTFSKLLLAIVALDDVWALILFAVGISVVKTLNGGGTEFSFFLTTFSEIGGALALGCIIGFPASYLTGRLKPGEPILTEAICIVFICGGFALLLDVSFLISAMVMGTVITNFAKHHDYPFHAIEGIEPIMMTIFFVLAGASLEISALQQIGWIGALYIILRSVGKVVGGYVGSHYSACSTQTKRWIGPALLPQAGVAIGMGLVSANHYPEYRQIILPIVISSTIVFELLGPIITKLAIAKNSTH